MSKLPWARVMPVLLAFGVLAALPALISGFYVELAMKVMILAIFALSLELLVGQTGLVCFGHAAFFGIGAYAVTLLSPEGEAGSLWWTLPAACGAAGVYALAVGALSLRTKGVYFIMITLAFAQMAYFVVHDTPWAVAATASTSTSSRWPQWRATPCWTWTSPPSSTVLCGPVWALALWPAPCC
ncbi:branched-chain amino acid ABC transporter permease [Ideonella paludis]|uniref:branched-chain amino acid ABC transporter permease n=1 Tax=Ideonella paludis TaxID=1233411 RepID=UPI00362B7507